MIGLRTWKYAACVAFISVLVTSPRTYSQDSEVSDEPLTKNEFARFLEEYQRFKGEYAKVKEENEALRGELEDVKAKLSALAQITNAEIKVAIAEERAAVVEEVGEEFERRIEPLLPGRTNFAIAGGAVTAYQDRQRAS